MQKIYIVTQTLRTKFEVTELTILRVYSDRNKAVEYAKALLDNVDGVDVFSEDTCWTYQTSAMDTVWVEIQDYILE